MAAYSDITDQVSKRNIFALNNLKSAGPENLFAGDRTLACRSDTDSQMIIHFPFEQNVKLFALILDAPEGEEPTTIKLYTNRPTLGFDELDDIEPTQVLTLSPSDYSKDKQHKLKFVKFQNVASLFVFLDREGGERCALSAIKFVGQTIQGSSGELKKVEHEH